MYCIELFTHQLVILSMISTLLESAYISITLTLLSICAVGYAESAFRSFWVVCVSLRATILFLLYVLGFKILFSRSKRFRTWATDLTMTRMLSPRIQLYDANRRTELKECPICLETIVHGALACTLHCGHIFHAVCILQWLEVHTTCVLCRTPVLMYE